MHRRIVALVAIAVVFSLAGCKKKPTTPAEAVLQANKVSARPVTLFYETPELLLGPEQRTVPLPENEAAALPIVVRELLKGSSNAAVPRLFPADVIARGVYSLPDGTAIVDLGGNSLTNGWSAGSHTELMALYSVVSTVTTNFPAIKQVRFVVNGQVVDTLAGHVALNRALKPSAVFVAPAVQRQSVPAR